MRVVFELVFEETLDVNALQSIANRITDAISGYGPKAYPRLLVELQPTYLEIPLRSTAKSKSQPV